MAEEEIKRIRAKYGLDEEPTTHRTPEYTVHYRQSDDLFANAHIICDAVIGVSLGDIAESKAMAYQELAGDIYVAFRSKPYDEIAHVEIPKRQLDKLREYNDYFEKIITPKPLFPLPTRVQTMIKSWQVDKHIKANALILYRKVT